MRTVNGSNQATVQDRRTQAVLDKAAATIAQMQIDQALQRAITDQIFDTSHAAAFRAVHSADFINRLIDITPSLTEAQEQELHGVVNDLILIARKAPQEAYERGKLAQQKVKEPQRSGDALDGFLGELRGEWNALLQELTSITRWLRS